MDPFHTYYLSAPFYYAPSHWLVQTYEHTYAGVESVESATLQSDNTVYARMALDVGPANIVAMAHKLGVRTPLKAVPSLALGSIGVTPLDMASAYATLAAGGIYSKPMAITKVVLPNGKVDRDGGWGKPKRVRVIPDWVASTVTQVLEQNMLAGTGVGANVSGHTDAGKTGTTDNYADAWFSGYTPFLESTVWIGYPKAEIPMLDVHGIAVSGPTFPATIWRLFMETAIGNRPDRKFAAAKTPAKFISWHGTYQYSGTYQTYTPTPSYVAPATTTTATTTPATHATPPTKPVPPAPPASNPPTPPATTVPTPP
jgi:penicillin-binding protein 1A